MPDDEQPSGRPRTTSRPFSGGRLKGFSDGVFSIAATLLVLEISVPSGSEDDLLGAFLGQWPSYLAYAVSFATIGGAWLAHNVITEYVHHVDPVFVRINLLLLMSVSLLPFPTRLIAEYIGERSAERVAATVYGLILIAVALLLSALWRYAVRRQLVHPDVNDTDVRLITRRLEPSLGAYVALLVIGLSCRWPPSSATWRSRSTSSPRSATRPAGDHPRRCERQPDHQLTPIAGGSAALSANRCVLPMVPSGVFIRAG